MRPVRTTGATAVKRPAPGDIVVHYKHDAWREWQSSASHAWLVAGDRLQSCGRLVALRAREGQHGTTWSGSASKSARVGENPATSWRSSHPSPTMDHGGSKGRKMRKSRKSDDGRGHGGRDMDAALKAPLGKSSRWPMGYLHLRRHQGAGLPYRGRLATHPVSSRSPGAATRNWNDATINRLTASTTSTWEARRGPAHIKLFYSSAGRPLPIFTRRANPVSRVADSTMTSTTISIQRRISATSSSLATPVTSDHLNDVIP